VVKLEQNFRSSSAILQAANNVIGPNPKLFPKTPKPQNPKTPKFVNENI